MKLTLSISLFFSYSVLFSQYNHIYDFDFQSIPFVFEKDTVNILIAAHSETKTKKKPLVLFVQGSLPKPLCIYDKHGGGYSTFPFNYVPYLND